MCEHQSVRCASAHFEETWTSALVLLWPIHRVLRLLVTTVIIIMSYLISSSYQSSSSFLGLQFRVAAQNKPAVSAVCAASILGDGGSLNTYNCCYLLQPIWPGEKLYFGKAQPHNTALKGRTRIVNGTKRDSVSSCLLPVVLSQR